MNRLIAVFVLVLCITVSVTYLTVAQAASEKVFQLPEENGNIILPEDASYAESGIQYFNSTVLQIHVWDIPMFTTGNGTINIYASAHNCNLTVNSYKQASNPMETQYRYNVSNSIDCTVAGDGVARFNFGSFDGSNLAVYIDGVLRQPGDGWNITDGYIAIQGPVNFTVYSGETEYWPPRGAPHDEFFYPTGLLIAVAVAVLAVAALAGILYSKRKRGGNQ